jgi:hypothetical protein
MNTYKWLNCAAIALPLTLAAHQVLGQTVDPNKLPKVECTELTYSQEFLAKYPKAPAACLEARVAHGKRYAKFSGQVYIPGTDVITVQIFNVAGDPLSTFSFKPSPDARVIINGKKVPYSQLAKGDPVTFWVSENRFAVYTAPGATKGVSAAVAPR